MTSLYRAFFKIGCYEDHLIQSWKQENKISIETIYDDLSVINSRIIGYLENINEIVNIYEKYFRYMAGFLKDLVQLLNDKKRVITYEIVFEGVFF